MDLRGKRSTKQSKADGRQEKRRSRNKPRKHGWRQNKQLQYKQRKIHILRTRETKKIRHRGDKEKDMASGMRCVDFQKEDKLLHLVTDKRPNPATKNPKHLLLGLGEIGLHPTISSQSYSHIRVTTWSRGTKRER